MFDKDSPYTLRVEKINDETHYYVSFRDGQAVLYEMEIDLELYKAFRKFEKQNKHEQNFFDRHVEHSESTEEALIKRAACPPKSVEEQICDMEGCSFQAVAKSVTAAEEKIKKFMQR